MRCYLGKPVLLEERIEQIKQANEIILLIFLRA